MRLAREACDVANDADDLCRQNGSYPEDFGEGGARSLHLLPDALVQIGYAPVEGANVTHYLGGQLLSGSRWFVPWSDSPQQPEAASAESCFLTMSERRFRRSTCKRFRARVRSATRSSRLSVSSLRTST